MKSVILDELESGCDSFETFDIDAKAEDFAQEEKRLHESKGKRADLCMNPNVAKRICDKMKSLKLPTTAKEIEVLESKCAGQVNEPPKGIKEIILDEIQTKGYKQLFDTGKLAEEFAEEEMLRQLQNCTIDSDSVAKRISQRLALKAKMMKA